MGTGITDVVGGPRDFLPPNIFEYIVMRKMIFSSDTASLICIVPFTESVSI
jgi:hypothetical protein